MIGLERLYLEMVEARGRHMGTKEELEKNGFDLLRYLAAVSVMMLHYSGYCMMLSKNLQTAGRLS